MTKLSNLICAVLVTVTAYNGTVKQCGNARGVTSTGAAARPGICAVSHDLRHLLHKTIYLKGVGKFKVADLMNHKHRRRVDIYTCSPATAKKFGKRKIELQVCK